MSNKREIFSKQFSKEKYLEFRKTYEAINPDRPRESANVKYEETEAFFRKYLEKIDESNRSFVEEMLPHLGLFLHGPFPLPDNRVTTSAWDCRGKLGAYKAVGALPRIAGSRVLDIGCNAGYDTFLMSSLGALEVVGLEPFERPGKLWAQGSVVRVSGVQVVHNHPVRSPLVCSVPAGCFTRRFSADRVPDPCATRSPPCSGSVHQRAVHW